MADIMTGDAMLPGRSALGGRAGMSTAAPDGGSAGLRVQEVALFSIALRKNTEVRDVTLSCGIEDKAGAWLIDAVNAPGSAFAHTLNQQAATFGARMVVSHAAQGDASNATAASAQPDWSTANANA